jgi:hypothetical protein
VWFGGRRSLLVKLKSPLSFSRVKAVRCDMASCWLPWHKVTCSCFNVPAQVIHQTINSTGERL